MRVTQDDDGRILATWAGHTVALLQAADDAMPLWRALSVHLGDLPTLGDAALALGVLWDAAQSYRAAAAQGDARAGAQLLLLFQSVDPA